VHLTESIIRAIGYHNVAAIVTEVVYGVGRTTPAPEYFPQIRKMTKELGILWVDDETIAGAGRMGSWFAYQVPEYGGGAKPDMMVTGKGIINSQLPCGGIVFSKEIADWIRDYFWASAATYKALPVVMATVAANMQIMLEDKVVERGYEMGKYLGSQLNELQKKHKCIGQVTGRGGFFIVDIDKNKETREPFIKEDRNAECWTMPDWKAPNMISEKAAEKGVFIATFTPNAIPICPTLTWKNEQVDQMIEAFDYALGFVDEVCD
jgi:taurine--2-oxoglutarate transaminase